MTQDIITSGYFAIEREMQKQQEHYDSIKGKDTPFRVEFRFKKGYLRWLYFATLEEAKGAESPKKCSYNIWGCAVIESPSSRQIQIRGPRGGWKKYIPELKARGHS